MVTRARVMRSAQPRRAEPMSPPHSGPRLPADTCWARQCTARARILQAAESVIASAGPRASLADIAAAAGILAGSLYHHFSTKEELLLELVQGFHADIDEVANAALDDTGHLHTGPFPAAIYDFGSAIARCAVRHPAALQMSFFEAPSANPSLAQLLSARPTTLQYTMTQILAAGVANGLLRSPVALSALADRICQSLMHVGLDVIRHNADAEDVATLLCRIMTTGLSTRAPTDDELDSSAAFAAAEKTIGSWGEDSHVEVTGESAYIHAVAREQFGRRGYEVTSARHHQGQRLGSCPRVLGGRLQRQVVQIDHGGVRTQGQWWFRRSPGQRRHRGREARCAQLGQHQRDRPLPRRVEDSARVAAPAPAEHTRTRPGLCPATGRTGKPSCAKASGHTTCRRTHHR